MAGMPPQFKKNAKKKQKGAAPPKPGAKPNPFAKGAKPNPFAKKGM